MSEFGSKAVSVANPVVPFNDVLKCVQEVLAIGIVSEDGFLFIAP
jgi:hypothetical protein